MGLLARHQDLMGCSESRFTRCADRDMPFGEQQTHAYLRCVLPLALPGDTDGPWCVPIKGKYAWHCIASPSLYTDGCSAGQRGLLPSSLSLCWHRGPWLIFVWGDDVLIERWWVGGKLWVSLAQPTNRGLLGRETHKLGGVVVLIETSWYNMMCIHLR